MSPCWLVNTAGRLRHSLEKGTDTVTRDAPPLDRTGPGGVRDNRKISGRTMPRSGQTRTGTTDPVAVTGIGKGFQIRPDSVSSVSGFGFTCDRIHFQVRPDSALSRKIGSRQNGNPSNISKKYEPPCGTFGTHVGLGPSSGRSTGSCSPISSEMQMIRKKRKVHWIHESHETNPRKAPDKDRSENTSGILVRLSSLGTHRTPGVQQVPAGCRPVQVSDTVRCCHCRSDDHQAAAFAPRQPESMGCVQPRSHRIDEEIVLSCRGRATNSG